MKTLVLEDNIHDTNLIKEILESEGDYEIVPVYNSAKAIEEIQNRSFDLLILDCQLLKTPEDKAMGDMAGLLTGRKILDMGYSIPIVVMTNFYDDESFYLEAKKILGINALSFINKSELTNNRNKVLDAINQVVELFYENELPKGFEHPDFRKRKIRIIPANRQSKDFFFIDIDELVLIYRSEENGVPISKILLSDGQVYDHNQSVKRIAEKLNKVYPNFVKVNGALAINLEKILEVRHCSEKERQKERENTGFGYHGRVILEMDDEINATEPFAFSPKMSLVVKRRKIVVSLPRTSFQTAKNSIISQHLFIDSKRGQID